MIPKKEQFAHNSRSAALRGTALAIAMLISDFFVVDASLLKNIFGDVGPELQNKIYANANGQHNNVNLDVRAHKHFERDARGAPRLNTPLRRDHHSPLIDGHSPLTVERSSLRAVAALAPSFLQAAAYYVTHRQPATSNKEATDVKNAVSGVGAVHGAAIGATTST
eukprot:Selendium_serpulae@DN10119_c0_g1_i1.p1